MASENNEESSIKKKIEDALDDDKIEEGKEKVKDFVGMNNSDKDESDKKRNSVMTVQSEEESIVSSTKGVHGSNSIEGKQSDSKLNDSNMSVNGSKSTLNNSNLNNNDSNMTVNGSNSKLNDSKISNNNMSDNNSKMSDNNSVNKNNMMGGVINKQPSKENSLNNSKESLNSKEGNNSKESLNSKEGSNSKESLNSKEGNKSKESLNSKGKNSKSVSFAENDEVVEVNSYVPTTLLYPVEDSEVLKYREKDMIICEGFAFKKRPICCCLWHQKYFVLLKTGKLVYHKCDGSRPAKGDWNTLDCEAEKGISYNASHPYRLLLSNGIILGFDIEEDRNYWFTMITRHKQMIKVKKNKQSLLLFIFLIKIFIPFLMAKRKTLVFKTPKKVNKTPLKLQKSIVNVSNNSNDELLNLNKNFKEVDEKSLNKRVNKKIDKEIKKGDDNFDFNENDLIKQLRKENDELRSLNNAIYIYQKLLGITINNDNNEYFVTIERESNNLKKYLSFGLKEINNSYQYKLYKNENCILPQRFVDDIQFENTEIHKFFYYIIQGMYNK